MNETTLNDLQQKIRNTVRDFELEYGLEGLVSVSLESPRKIAVEVREWASGGPVMGGQNYIIGRGDEKELYVPAPSGVIPPNESIYPMGDVHNITIHANDAAGGKAAADAFGDRLKEELSDRPARKGPPDDPLKDRKGI